MLDSKLTALTADTSRSLTDLVYTVTDPSGTPASRKMTVLNFLREDATELTISSGAVTFTQLNHKLQPQSGTADDLDTISGTTAGQSGTIYVSDFGTDTITLKHNTGNILCVGGTDVALSNGCAFWYSNGTKIFVSGGGGGSGSAFKNRVINGDFQVAQRGTTFDATTAYPNNDDAYVLDRWYLLTDGNDAVDVTQNTADAPTNQQYCIRLDVETANKKFGIAQIIEKKNLVGILGNTVTLSFSAKVSATTNLDNVKCAIVAWSGTADSVTSDIISAWGVEGPPANSTAIGVNPHPV